MGTIAHIAQQMEFPPSPKSEKREQSLKEDSCKRRGKIAVFQESWLPHMSTVGNGPKRRISKGASF